VAWIYLEASFYRKESVISQPPGTIYVPMASKRSHVIAVRIVTLKRWLLDVEETF
jgi:hypothetical protein